MTSIRSFSPATSLMTPNFSSQKAFPVKRVSVANEVLTFQSVGEGIHISQDQGINTIQIQPKGIQLNHNALTPEARKGLILTFNALKEGAEKNGHNPCELVTSSGTPYKIMYGAHDIKFYNQNSPANIIGLYPDLFRVAEQQISEPARRDLIDMVGQLLEMQ
ncbi:MAG: hypothetical protein U0003_01445 [Vampirovibrionales bacterium]